MQTLREIIANFLRRQRVLMKRPVRRGYMNFIRSFDFKFTGRWMLFSIVIGIVSGIGAVVFFYLLHLLQTFFMHDMAGFHAPTPGGEGGGSFPPLPDWIDLSRWPLILIPAIGGLVSGFLVYTFAPEAEGHGTDAVIKAFHRKRGFIRGRVPIIKAIASVFTIGTGGSAGREGPIAQIGAGFGSVLATWLNLPYRERRIMVVSGMAGGIGSIFRSPLGGAIFAVEALYNEDLETEAIFPAIISSITAYSVFATTFGWHTVFDTVSYQFSNPLELPFYIIFSVVCSIVGIVYVKVFYGLKKSFFDKMKIANHWKPVIGGLMLGVVGFFFPYVFGSGYGWVQMALLGKLSLGIMVGIVFLKILATSFSISSGGSGGIFAPSLVIGAMLGGAFGTVAHYYFPAIVLEPATFVLVGMAAFFAGSANVPISVTIMISEMTGGYGLLVPLIFSSTIAYFVAKRWSIYDQQVENKSASLAHRSDFVKDLLEDIEVADAYEKVKALPRIPNDLPLARVMALFSDYDLTYFPVVDPEGAVTGVISLDSIRTVMSDQHQHIYSFLVADDIRTQLATVTLDEKLSSALDRFLDTDYDELFVVDPNDPTKIVGIVSQQNLITAYDNALLRLAQEDGED